jgi:hypothetical protein
VRCIDLQGKVPKLLFTILWVASTRLVPKLKDTSSLEMPSVTNALFGIVEVFARSGFSR